MDAIWVVLISTGIPAAITLAGYLLNRRRGIPTAIEADIDSHVGAVMALLKEEIAQRKEAAEACEKELAIQRDERVKEREELTARVESLEHDKDSLQAQVNRLLAKLNGGSA